MAKKSFTDNPALKFLSTLDTEPEEITPPTAEPTAKQPKAKPQKETEQSRLDELRGLIPEGFIVPEGYTLTPIKERRTKRIQLVIEPSLYEKLKAAAGKAGISLNEYSIQALNEKIAKENEE